MRPNKTFLLVCLTFCSLGLNAERLSITTPKTQRIRDKYPQALWCEDQRFSGAYLMEHGLELPENHDVDRAERNNWASRVLQLTAE